MYRQYLCIAIIAGICSGSIAATSLEEGVQAYLNARTTRYFGGVVPSEQQERITAFKQQHPKVHADLNELTNKSEAPGSRYMNWLSQYLDPVAETVSSWFGWHNAILDALRPELQNTDEYHRKNVNAYMEAVKKYVYNKHEVAAHAPRDIFTDLLEQLQLEYTLDIPYRHNLFVQLMATLDENDVQYILKRLKQELPEQQAKQRQELFNNLTTHFEHITIALQSIAIEDEENEHQQTQTQEQQA